MMPRSMPSEELQLLIAGYVLGDLDAAEAAEFEQLLATDPTIVAKVEQMQNALEVCLAPPEVPPPSQLRDTILAAAAPQTGEAKLDEAKPIAAKAAPDRSSFQRRRDSRFRWDRAAGVAAAVMIVALGFNNYRLWRTLQQSNSQPDQFATRTYSLKGTKAARNASATIAVNPNTLEAKLTAQNLPPLPPGKTYVLWTVLKQGAPFTTDSKDAILTEVFEAEGNTSRTVTLPEVYRSQELIAKVAVTIEDAASPQKHIGDPFMVASN